ncbi:hypothetical protein [Dactylosporangium salmoneum]|uniref:Uncharacterized protein n=1 Tax=Dactylosporangium salmoneum TaxID=53361 RepID=A0ABN3GHG1_9ACTN
MTGSATTADAIGPPPVLPWESAPALNRIWHIDPTAYSWHFLAELARAICWGWQAWR